MTDSKSEEGLQEKFNMDKEDSTSDNSEYETDDDVSEEEVEPRLKYERVRADVVSILALDTLSCISANDKMVALGTMGGRVTIIDHLGYKIQTHSPHTAPVIDVHISGDYWASVSRDKKVVVQGVLTTEHNCNMFVDFSSMSCVVLDPSFSQSRYKTRFVVGHSAGLTLFERSLFGGYKQTLISSTAGATQGSHLGLTGGSVTAAAWSGVLVAWATEAGVRVYDLNIKTTIAIIQRDHSAALNSTQFPPHMIWSSSDTLLIGWGDSVKVCRVKERPKQSSRENSLNSSPTHTMSRKGSVASLIASPQSSETTSPRSVAPVPPFKVYSSQALQQSSSSRSQSRAPQASATDNHSTVTTPPLDLPPHQVDIENMFTTEFYICGLSMLEDNIILALTYNKTPSLEGTRSSPTDTKGPQQFTDDPFEWRRPQLRLLQPHQKTYEEVSKDILGTYRYKDYLPLHYKLQCVPSGDRWYVLSPRDLVAVKMRESLDSIQWLLQHHKYAQALQLLAKEGGSIDNYTEESVGKEYLKYLLDCKLYSDAARIASKVVGDDITRWSELVKMFIDMRQMSVLHDSLPCSTECHLSVETYDLVLKNLFDTDVPGLLRAVQKWPSWCYSVGLLVSIILQRVATENYTSPLLQTLAHLYSHQQNHEKALAIYLRLEHKDIFTLIKKHSLYSSISVHAVQLMTLDADMTVELCMRHIKQLPPTDMIDALQGHSLLLYKYLKVLYAQHRALCTGHHDLLLEMMADNKQDDELLAFLKSSTGYDLTNALRVCKDRGLLHHTVYLLERTGNTQDALSLVLLEAGDLEWAIKLCVDHNDTHLWDTLIDNTIEHSHNIRPLLEKAGKYVGEINILQRLPDGLEVKGIVTTLLDILNKIKKNLALHKGCNSLYERDIVHLVKRRKAEAKRAIVGDRSSMCQTCGLTVLATGVASSVIAFKCSHIYHKDCLQVSPPLCTVCQLKSNLFG